MTTTLKERIQEDMKAAMRAKEAQRLGTIRLLLAAIKQREVDERITLDDSQILAIIDKMLKQRLDSIQQFQAANREDLVQQEQFESDLLRGYLPPALSEAEIEAMIHQAITATQAQNMRDMGKVMNQLRPELQGRADMSLVSAKIKQILEAKS